MSEELEYLEKPTYAAHGENDDDGFQIFTPEFIVNGMIDAIGKKEVLDFSKTILEPTSGDGAFTCRILEMRLQKCRKDRLIADALRALSTIYSIEMDEKLIKAQRNNVYTIMVNFAKQNKAESDSFYELLKDIIYSNFVWAMTNTNFDPAENVLFQMSYFAHKMPGAEKGKEDPVILYSWKINDDLAYEKTEEEVEA